ncbi:MAG: hypothetical protein LBM25_00820 [Bacteroidales bacterium]|jgi:cell division protein FtsQ|nr:hypothetical protein [Bacteroidales bacterium]
MSKKGKRIVFGFVAVILIITIIISANIFMQNKNVSKLNLSITYNNTDTILSSNEINIMLINAFGNISSKKRKEVYEEKIEKYLKENPYVEDAKVYQTLNGEVNIDIKQREPIVRIYTKNNKSYYVDKKKKVIPINQGEITDVVVASGRINPSSEKDISKIYDLATKLEEDSILKYQIDQIYFSNKDEEVELIPKIGNYTIKINIKDSLEEQLTKLHLLYKEGFVINGWNNYDNIDLRFKNQVVCRKPQKS